MSTLVMLGLFLVALVFSAVAILLAVAGTVGSIMGWDRPSEIALDLRIRGEEEVDRE